MPGRPAGAPSPALRTAAAWRPPGPPSGDRADRAQVAGQRNARRADDLDVDEVARCRRRAACDAEVDGLVVAGAAAQTVEVGPRRPLDENLERATDEALRALGRTALDRL